MNEKIRTQHPSGKSGVNIDAVKYNAVRAAILNTVEKYGQIPFMDLPAAVSELLPSFDGSVGWYVTTIKLDLEARGELERFGSPQHLRLPKN